MRYNLTGKEGLPSNGLPANAAVHVFLKLLNFQPAPNPGDRSYEDKMEIGRRKKKRGNNWFAKEEFQLAMFCYKKAAEYFDDEQLDFDVPIDRFALDENLQELLEERIKTLNNLAMCQIKLNLMDAALVSIKQVLKVEVRFSCHFINNTIIIKLIISIS